MKGFARPDPSPLRASERRPQHACGTEVAHPSGTAARSHAARRGGDSSELPRGRPYAGNARLREGEETRTPVPSAPRSFSEPLVPAPPLAFTRHQSTGCVTAYPARTKFRVARSLAPQVHWSLSLLSKEKAPTPFPSPPWGPAFVVSRIAGPQARGSGGPGVGGGGGAPKAAGGGRSQPR